MRLMHGFGLAFQKQYQLRQISINYLSEARFQDRVVVNESSSEGPIFNHQLIRQSDGVDLCRARSLWQALT